jgi:hypothetical protein
MTKPPLLYKRTFACLFGCCFIAFQGLVACTSMEGMIYQEKKLEASECVQFSGDKYKELIGFFRGVCLTHGQLARMADIESDDGLPSLQQAIFDACIKESDTTLEVILFKRFGVTLEGDLPGVLPDDPRCRGAQASK